MSISSYFGRQEGVDERQSFASHQSVLVVDDDPMVRSALVDELGIDFDVTGVGSGEDALSRLERRRYDALVTDVRMPGMDGVTLMDRARTMQPDLVRIFLTGYADDHVVRSAIAWGAYKLRKPWGSELTVTLRSALQHKEQYARMRRMAALGAVAAGVAHDVRSPLSALKMNMTLLDEELKEQPIFEVLRDILADNHNAIEAIERVLHTMHAVSERPESSGPVDIHYAIDLAVRLSRRQFSERNIQVRVDAPKQLAATGTPGEVGQVLLNLLTNGAQASPRGGTVEIRAQQYERWASITVHDSGWGVNADDAETIFTPFQTSKPDGMGLGLSISREMARRHGGDLVLRNPGEPGACFELRLPLAQPEAPTTKMRPVPPSSNSSSSHEAGAAPSA